MKIIELSKNCCKRFYDGNYHKMIESMDGIIFDDKRIKEAFCFHNGKAEDFLIYVKNNRAYCRYFDLINCRYI